jgi:hypothetical protein
MVGYLCFLPIKWLHFGPCPIYFSFDLLWHLLRRTLKQSWETVTNSILLSQIILCTRLRASDMCFTLQTLSPLYILFTYILINPTCSTGIPNSLSYHTAVSYEMKFLWCIHLTIERYTSIFRKTVSEHWLVMVELTLVLKTYVLRIPAEDRYVSHPKVCIPIYFDT